MALGSNSSGQCNVGDWEGIIQVAVGARHTLGLKSDGTVVAVGNNSSGQYNTSTPWLDDSAYEQGYGAGYQAGQDDSAETIDAFLEDIQRV